MQVRQMKASNDLRNELVDRVWIIKNKKKLILRSTKDRKMWRIMIVHVLKLHRT